MGDRVLRSKNDGDVWKANKQRAGESLCFSSIPLLSSPIKPWERQSEAGAEQPESLVLNGPVSAKWKYSVFSSTLSGSPQYGPLSHHHNHKRQLHLNCHSSLQSLYLSASVSFLCHISLVLATWTEVRLVLLVIRSILAFFFSIDYQWVTKINVLSDFMKISSWWQTSLTCSDNLIVRYVFCINSYIFCCWLYTLGHGRKVFSVLNWTKMVSDALTCCQK